MSTIHKDSIIHSRNGSGTRGVRLMVAEGKRPICGIMFVVIIFLMVGSPVLTVYAVNLPNDLCTGPYVDKVVFKVTPTNPILALQANELELAYATADPRYIPDFDADPDISYRQILRNGYGHITINCAKYPLNISGFRRAFAYAFDTTYITTEIFDGFSRKHDSLVPYTNPWCVEDDFPYHYYSARPDLGNAILDSLNFQIDTDTGFRTAPDGSTFKVVLEYSYSDSEILEGIGREFKDAFASLYVEAEVKPGSIWDILARLDMHTDYDMVFYGTNWADYDVNWLAKEYWSGNADVDFHNRANFENDTFDSWRDQLLHSTNYEDVYEASAAMQLILHENVPDLVVYENIYVIPYRTDMFTGHVEDIGRSIFWTLLNMRKIDGTLGGTVRVAIGNPETFNIFIAYDEHSAPILAELWPSLYRHGPDGNPEPYIAEGMIIETNDDNPQVPEGHTRFTIDIVQNATWNDGEPFTAEDIALTYSYAFESLNNGNPFGVELAELVAAYAPTRYTVVIEFSTESWWHFSTFAYLRIIPHHIFNNIDGIGYRDWNKWNPVFDPEDPLVTCGPFTLTDNELGEFFELSANPNYWYYPQERRLSPTTTTNNGSSSSFDATLALTVGTIGACAVILVGYVGILKIEK